MCGSLHWREGSGRTPPGQVAVWKAGSGAECPVNDEHSAAGGWRVAYPSETHHAFGVKRSGLCSSLLTGLRKQVDACRSICYRVCAWARELVGLKVTWVFFVLWQLFCELGIIPTPRLGERARQGRLFPAPGSSTSPAALCGQGQLPSLLCRWLSPESGDLVRALEASSGRTSSVLLGLSFPWERPAQHVGQVFPWWQGSE